MFGHKVYRILNFQFLFYWYDATIIFFDYGVLSSANPNIFFEPLSATSNPYPSLSFHSSQGGSVHIISQCTSCQTPQCPLPLSSASLVENFLPKLEQKQCPEAHTEHLYRLPNRTQTMSPNALPCQIFSGRRPRAVHSPDTR